MQQLVKFVFLSFLLALALTRKCSHTLCISPHSPSSSPIWMSRQIALTCVCHIDKQPSLTRAAWV